MRVPIEIITCGIWDARKPKQGITTVPASQRIIFHHTAGHHAEIENPRDESRAEAVRFARDIQTFHMDTNGWIDSGHNFLVCRNGLILQGRWLTVSAIEAGHMVQSAHCAQKGKPGSNQNDQIGIEHEHLGSEKMTSPQKWASATLMAWISWQYGKARILPVHPHSRYCDTACPANLKADISAIRAAALQILRGGV